MDLLAIGDDLAFVEQPGKRYTPTGTGQHALTVRFRGDVRYLAPFLSGKAKGTEIDDGFYIEDVEVIMGATDAALDPTFGNGSIVNGTVGEVEVVIRALGAITTYSADKIITGGPATRSSLIWKISTEFLYSVNYSTVIHTVEVTTASIPGSPAQETASGIGSAPDPLIMSARPVLIPTEQGLPNEGLKGPPIDPSSFAEGTDYTAYNHFDGASFRSQGDNYRSAYHWVRGIKPIQPA